MIGIGDIGIKSMIKESFDDLPSGLCFFNRNGLLKICNRKMYDLMIKIAGIEIQEIGAFKHSLENPSVEGVHVINGVHHLNDGSAWYFVSNEIEDAYGNRYTEFIAYDATELYEKKIEFENDNQRLKKMTNQIRKLSSNVAVAAREEELLALKMRVHDQMGRSLVAAHRILAQNKSMDNANEIMSEWHKAVELLEKAGVATSENDMLTELKEISKGMIEIIVDSDLPEDEEAAYIIVSAIRECVTNAIRYAEASELYVKISIVHGNAEVIITNNGISPAETIEEGGGLSTLRNKVESNGGFMEITSIPVFELKITVPLNKEE